MVYHVISRGNARQIIFEDDQDHERYLELLARTSRRFSVRCLAYCLIGNHVHLLLQPGDIPLSRMMQQLNSVYCQWFNRRHSRVGHVLQGRYKAILVECPDYFFTVLRYIMMNPVAAKLVDEPGEWRWSSFRATAGLERCPEFLCVEEVWGAFNAPDEQSGQKRFITHLRMATDSFLPGQALILGSASFVSRFRSKLRAYRNVDAHVRLERHADRPPLAMLCQAGMDRMSLALAAQRAFNEHAYTLREIGTHVSRAPGTVWAWIHRLARTIVRPGPGCPLLPAT